MAGLDWIELPDGSHMARGKGPPDGREGTYWIRYRPSAITGKHWVAQWEPDSDAPKEAVDGTL